MRVNPMQGAIAAIGVGLFLSASHSYAAGLFLRVPGLSAEAQASLVAHYDGRTGVSTNGTSVDSWTPVDGNGNSVSAMAVTSTARGTGAASLISYDGSGNRAFEDTATGAEISALSETRTARAFMLLGRVAGTFT